MKRASSFIVFILLSSSVFAQDFFIKAGLGAGISGESSTAIGWDILGYSKTLSSNYAQLTAGRTFGRIQLEAGISYLRTGGDYDVKSDVTAFFREAKFEIKNDHVIVPVMISYIINKDRKISFYPGAGVAMAYNFEGKVTYSSGEWDNITPNTNNNVVSGVLLLRFDAQYRINKRWGIWCGIAYHQMITSLLTATNVYDFAGTFNAGVRYNMFRHKGAKS